MIERIRWSLVISRDTDMTLRTYLGRHGMRKGDLSKFVEDAVHWRVLDLAVAEAKAANAMCRLRKSKPPSPRLSTQSVAPA